MREKDLNVAIIGLGYVGLPLAVEFAKKRSVIAFDINIKRIEDLKEGKDRTHEISKKELDDAKKIILTSKESDLKAANCFIVTVPTPILENKKPDLSIIIEASKTIGKKMKSGDLVIYESTVYPGVIEEICAPTLELYSGLKFNLDFFCGYSPERINPGDKTHKLANIKKITSGSTPEIATLVDDLYKTIINAGTHKASSIKVAEAAKVIENTQRDINIALINEFSIIFNKMKIDTQEVLEAAGTKWNFLPFRPGLVGGHCIGVDPYYLAYKSQQMGHNPEIILSGRRLNDSMGYYVAENLINTMILKKIRVQYSKILIMGFSFKENCPDVRNTRVIDIVSHLKSHDCSVDVYDPIVNKKEIKDAYNIDPIKTISNGSYDAIIIAVAHEEFKKLEFNTIKNMCKKNHVIYDLKYVFTSKESNLRL
jgi:UDP-N-acetyl-D-galactosamine dehydrogenase